MLRAQFSLPFVCNTRLANPPSLVAQVAPTSLESGEVAERSVRDIDGELLAMVAVSAFCGLFDKLARFL